MSSSKINDNTDPVLTDLVNKLTDAYHPLRMYLFGSRAQGSATTESDYDIMLVMPDNSPRELKSAGKAYEALWGTAVPVDILVWTESAFSKRLDIANSLPAKVAREGRLLYGS